MSHNEEAGHGHSLAAWVTVGLVTLAFAIGTLFFWFDNALVVWLSAGLALAAPVVGYLLKQAGYGVGGSKSSSH